MRRLAVWLAARRVPPEEREFALGDLEEEYDQRLARDGRRAAAWWYWRAALRSLRVRPAAGRDDLTTPFRAGAVMHNLGADVRVALRRLFARPLLSGIAIATLALGIGANVAMFAVSWPVLAAPLPFPDEDRLVVVSLTYERDGVRNRNSVSHGDYVDMRAATSFASMAAFNKFTRQLNLTGRGDPQQLTVASVTAEFFETLGVRPLAGRLLQSTDDPADTRALVLTESTWRRQFAADPAVVGTTVRLDGIAYDVIGVAPATAALGTIGADAWTRQPIDMANRARGSYYLGVIARLSPGVSLNVANQELAAIMARAAEEFPQFNATLSAEAEPFRTLTTESVWSTMAMLIASATLVLFVAVINLGGLQVAAHLDRLREFSVRRALGAGRWQVARQLMTESLVVAIVGGAAGVVVAMFTLSALEAVAPSFGWRQLAPLSRWTVGAYAMCLTVCAGLLVGAVPAWRAAASGNTEGLQMRAQSMGRWATRARALLTAGQVAVTAVLLVGAALLTASQQNVLAVDPGVDLNSVVVANVNVGGDRYASLQQRMDFYTRLVDRVESIPAAESACLIDEVPLDRDPGWTTFVAEGQTDRVRSYPTTMTPGCVDVMRLDLREGRWPSREDVDPSIVISESLAAAFWPGETRVVGKRVHYGLATGPLMRVVGVSRDIHATTLEADVSNMVWLAASSGFSRPNRLLVRYQPTGGVEPAVLRAALKDVDPDLALAGIRSIDDIVDRATAPRRFALFLLAGFAAVAVVLCGVGLYGLLAHGVGQRTQEIGIRMALGARAGEIVRVVVLEVAAAVGIGVLAGLTGARALSSVVDALLYGVSTSDATVYVAAAAGVLVMAALAAWLPTRRALRIQPVTALRGD
jgi:predicted permease